MSWTATRAPRCGRECATDSDAVYRFALWAGAAVALLSVLLVLAIFGLRAALVWQNRRRARFLALWRPLLMESLVAPLRKLPALRRGDVFDGLLLWNHLQGSVRGDARERLNGFARAAGLDRAARRLLARRGLRSRLIAIVTLGQLGGEDIRPVLRRLAHAAHPVLSLTAARALVQIDGEAAVPALMPMFAARTDWPANRVAAILREAGPDAVSQSLLDALAVSGLEQGARLLGFFELAHPSVVMPAVRALLAHADTDDRLLAAALRALKDPQALPSVRALTMHPRWHIRMEAAKALGRLGLPEDLLRLERLLGDPQWWVRLRTAQAIARLPFVRRPDLEAMRDRQRDRYARDILAHVLAEPGRT